MLQMVAASFVTWFFSAVWELFRKLNPKSVSLALPVIMSFNVLWEIVLLKTNKDGFYCLQRTRCSVTLLDLFLQFLFTFFFFAGFQLCSRGKFPSPLLLTLQLSNWVFNSCIHMHIISKYVFLLWMFLSYSVLFLFLISRLLRVFMIDFFFLLSFLLTA